MNPNELERYHIQAPQNEYVIYFYDTLAELNNQETKDKLLSHPDVR